MMHSLTPAVRAHFSCYLCGSTSYRSVFDRNGAGAIRATSLYRCSGCTLTFRDPKDWRVAPSSVARAA